MNQLSDDEIIVILQSPDNVKKNQGLKQLYSNYYPLINNFIMANNGSEEEAADIFQDGIIVFYEKIRLGQLNLNCSIKTYIYSVCRNLWLNRLRSKKRITKLDETFDAIPIPLESLSVLDISERNELVMHLMEKLGEDCKKILTFFYFDRLRMKEIANKMTLANEQEAKNKKSNCMKKLRLLVLDSPKLINMLK